MQTAKLFENSYLPCLLGESVIYFYHTQRAEVSKPLTLLATFIQTCSFIKVSQCSILSGVGILHLC